MTASDPIVLKKSLVATLLWILSKNDSRAPQTLNHRYLLGHRWIRLLLSKMALGLFQHNRPKHGHS